PVSASEKSTPSVVGSLVMSRTRSLSPRQSRSFSSGTTVTAIRFRRNASERLLPWPSSSPPPPPLPPQPASARASAVVTIARMVEPLLQVPVSLHERRAANDLGGG